MITSSISRYDDLRSRKYTPYISRDLEIELYLKFDPKPKDITRGFIFEIDDLDPNKKKYDVILLENLDP